MESRIINVDTRSTSQLRDDPAQGVDRSCPHCGWEEVLVLQRESDQFNDCYRCRRCGHVFSPRS